MLLSNLQLLNNFIHLDTVMAFVINAFHVFNEKYLWGLVMNGKIDCNFIGDRPELYQVQVIKIALLRLISLFQTVFSHTTDGTTGTVFKNYLGSGFG